MEHRERENLQRLGRQIGFNNREIRCRLSTDNSPEHTMLQQCPHSNMQLRKHQIQNSDLESSPRDREHALEEVCRFCP